MSVVRSGRMSVHSVQRRSGRGQSTVELALVLPVIVLLLLLIVQAGLLVRDRVLVVHAARAAARAVVVDPTTTAAASALRRQGSPMSTASVRISGELSSGGLATVTVRMQPTRVPIVGRVVGGVVLEERLVVMIEGNGAP